MPWKRAKKYMINKTRKENSNIAMQKKKNKQKNKRKK